MAEEKLQQEAAAGAAGETSLLDDIIAATSLQPGDETYSMAKEGLAAFIKGVASPDRVGVKVSGQLVDDMIAQLDAQISRQLDAVLHNADFQKLESSWRSLKFLVDRTNFRENNKIEILNASKQDLLDDFGDAPEITKSGLYRHVYTAGVARAARPAPAILPERAATATRLRQSQPVERMMPSP
ncbi:hypothetical protein FACS1894158_17850 [Betaproteobacteria bacterium]|nr:hypothetical protein FACS1894158_17850 [Betaproteobacteria bacterium]